MKNFQRLALIVIIALLTSLFACQKEDGVSPGSTILVDLSFDYETSEISLSKVTAVLREKNKPSIASVVKEFDSQISDYQIKFELSPEQFEELIGQTVYIEIEATYKSGEHEEKVEKELSLRVKENDNKVSHSFSLLVPPKKVQIKVVLNIEYNNWPFLKLTSPIGIGLYPRSRFDPNGQGESYVYHSSPDYSSLSSPPQYSYTFNLEGPQAENLIGKKIWLFWLIRFQMNANGNFNSINHEEEFQVVEGYQEFNYEVVGP
jgi:hypothetical protein